MRHVLLTNNGSAEHTYRQLASFWALQVDISPVVVQRIVKRLSSSPPEKAYLACCIADEAIASLQSVTDAGDVQRAITVLALFQGNLKLYSTYRNLLSWCKQKHLNRQSGDRMSLPSAPGACAAAPVASSTSAAAGNARPMDAEQPPCNEIAQWLESQLESPRTGLTPSSSGDYGKLPLLGEWRELLADGKTEEAEGVPSGEADRVPLAPAAPPAGLPAHAGTESFDLAEGAPVAVERGTGASVGQAAAAGQVEVGANGQVGANAQAGANGLLGANVQVGANGQVEGNGQVGANGQELSANAFRLSLLSIFS